MADRRFPVRNGAAFVECGVPGCGNSCEVGRGQHNLPPDAIARFLTHRGWLIGRSAKKDRCPDHAHPTRQQPQENAMAADTKIVPINPPVPGASTKPPREMTRDDRRIIFAKLEDVYVDESTGYSKGWNDNAVALDLGVPRAWVELIREENFGPQKTEQSAEILEIMGRIDALDEQAAELIKGAMNLRKMFEECQSTALSALNRANTLERAADQLRADVKRLTGGK
jgi:hypothetical protein